MKTKIPSKKRFLFILRQAPHATLKNKEALDFALACAAFEQQVSLLFIDDGVYQLAQGQDTNRIQSKNHSAALAALHLYGIEHSFYHLESAQHRQLNLETRCLIENCRAVDDTVISQHIADHDFVFHY